MHSPDDESDPVQQARAFLGAGAETLDVDDLLDRLLDHRNSAHPDRFTDENAQKKASDRFKRAQELIEELERKRQHRLINFGSTELAKPSEFSKELTYRLQLNASADRLDALHQQLEEIRANNKELSEQLRSERDARRSLELENLKKIYEPSRARIVGVAIAMILGGSLAVLSQIDQIASLLKQYSPLSPAAFNITVFTICVIALSITLVKYLKHLEFRHMMRQACTTTFAIGFLSFARHLNMEFQRRYHRSLISEFLPGSDHITSSLQMWIYEHREELAAIDEDFEDKWESTKYVCSKFLHTFEPREGDESFDEHVVLQYLESYYRPSIVFDISNPITTFKGILAAFSPERLRRVYRTVLGLFSNEAKDHLKDAFLLHLIDRQLVDDPKAGGLVHRFRVR